MARRAENERLSTRRSARAGLHSETKSLKVWGGEPLEGALRHINIVPLSCLETFAEIS
jgi:hypothetical protein